MGTTKEEKSRTLKKKMAIPKATRRGTRRSSPTKKAEMIGRKTSLAPTRLAGRSRTPSQEDESTT